MAPNPSRNLTERSAHKHEQELGQKNTHCGPCKFQNNKAEERARQRRSKRSPKAYQNIMHRKITQVQ